MSALRFVSLLALTVWLGGMVTIGSTANADAASLVGEMLRRFHLVSYGAAAIVLVSLACGRGPSRAMHASDTSTMAAAT